jgi:hypothetical protein
MGATKRDLTQNERQFDGSYALSTASGVKQLLGDVLSHKDHASRRGNTNTKRGGEVL